MEQRGVLDITTGVGDLFSTTLYSVSWGGKEKARRLKAGLLLLNFRTSR
jgi:hypothetical protein